MIKVPLAGVIGAPVAHSRSPRLFAHWLSALGLPGHYVPLHVEGADLRDVIATLPAMGFRGCNVTVPHKEAALALAAEVTPRARAIGAANTLTFDGGRIVADCTDGIGFLANLGELQGARTAHVLGAGGAARAVVHALRDAGLRVAIANRTEARAEALAEVFGATVAPWGERPSADLLVNTTSLGMQGQPPLPVDLSAMPKGALVTDIVYAPLDTPLLAAARARGLRTVDGLGMLLHQAVPGFERWFGATPVMDEATRRAVLG
ncbi:MAG: shikimate dehydrogenase [Paracoccaceae bacterium]